MGWSSGGDYLDVVHKSLFPKEGDWVEDSQAYRVMSVLWKTLSSEDWDTQDEFIEGAELYHGGTLPPSLKRLFSEQGYTRIRDVKRNVYRWVDSYDLEHYSIKDYELA